MTKNVTVDEVLPKVKDIFFELYRSADIPLTILKEEPTSMGGLPAQEWNIGYVREGKQYLATQVWTIKDRKAHYLTFISYADESHSTFYPVFIKMVQTFEVIPLAQP